MPRRFLKFRLLKQACLSGLRQISEADAGLFCLFFELFSSYFFYSYQFVISFKFLSGQAVIRVLRLADLVVIGILAHL